MPASEAQIEALVDKLEDPEARAELIRNLELLTAAEAESSAAEADVPPAAALATGQFARTKAALASTAREAGNVVATVGDLPADLAALSRSLGKASVQAALWQGLGFLAVILALAAAAGFAVARAVNPVRRRLVGGTDRNWFDRLGRAVGRLLLELIPLAVFAGMAFALAAVLRPAETPRELVAVGVVAGLAWGIARAGARSLLAPENTAIGVIAVSEAATSRILRWFNRFLAIGVGGYTVIQTLTVLGAPAGWILLLDHVVRLGLLILALVAIVKAHKPVSTWLRGGDTSDKKLAGLLFVRRRLASIWAVLAAAALIALYGVWALGVPGGVGLIGFGLAGTVAVIVIAGLIDTALYRALGNGMRLPRRLVDRAPELKTRADGYSVWVLRLAHIVIWTVALGAILWAWGVPMGEVLAAPAVAVLWDSVTSILIVVLGAVIAWEVCANVIDHVMRQGDPETQSARVRTLLPLLRKIVIFVLGLMVTLIVLSELGVNIAPLLAGAGVIGLAVGFGSQQLVRDIITGAFMLMENSVRVGDVVTAGGYTGVVEAMTVRTMRLRDYSGNVHTVPFGDVSALTNMTREFAYAVLDIGVAYREDLDQVIAEMESVAAELRQDPEIGENILEDLEIAGVNSFDESQVTVRCRFKTKPIMQWAVGRAYRKKLKERFDAKGIEIPFPHRTVYFGMDKDGGAPPLRYAPAAAPEAGSDGAGS